MAQLNPGGTVTFLNYDAALHTTTSGTPADGLDFVWDSDISPASSVTVTLDDPGDYHYFCQVHPWITGLIIVEDEGDTASTSTTTSTTTSTYTSEWASSLVEGNLSVYTDKSVYVIGSDVYVTVVSNGIELGDSPIYIVLDSDMGTWVEQHTAASPSDNISSATFRLPANHPTTNQAMDRGEKITLYAAHDGYKSYNTLDIYSSNFDATIELDSKIYTWTDR